MWHSHSALASANLYLNIRLKSAPRLLEKHNLTEEGGLYYCLPEVTYYCHRIISYNTSISRSHVTGGPFLSKACYFEIVLSQDLLQQGKSTRTSLSTKSLRDTTAKSSWHFRPLLVNIVTIFNFKERDYDILESFSKETCVMYD